uniref:Uncharacterized protein n=1 Tax=Oryza brachyantha TaxID=4533 RepID=J3LE14_ORYBR
MESPGSGSGAGAAARAVPLRPLPPPAPTQVVDSEAGKSGRSCGGAGCSRSAFLAEPGKPVKKPKAGVMLVEETAAATAKERKPLAAVGKARFRVKVRRYKLLTEVISC